MADHPPTDLKTVSFRCHNRSSAPRPAHRRLRGSPAPSQRGETITQPVSKRFLSGVITGLRHGDPSYSHLSGILAWQSVLLTGLWHSDLAHRRLSGILAWRSVLLTGLRHGHPAQRYLRAIPVWRNGLLSGLRHGTPAHRCLSGILAEPL